MCGETNKRMCALQDFMHRHPKSVMAVHLCFSVCVYISVHASLNLHYLPHYSCSFTAANSNCSSKATRCVCVFLHTRVLVHAMSLGPQYTFHAISEPVQLGYFVCFFNIKGLFESQDLVFR